MFTRCLRFLYLLLFLLTPLIFTSFNSELFEIPKIYLVYTLTLLIIGCHLLNFLRGQAPLFRRTFLDLPLLLFLTSQIISTFTSVDPHTSIFAYYSRPNGGLLSTVAFLLLHWVLVVYIDADLKSKIINLSLISGFLVAVFGILEHFGIDAHLWVEDVRARVFSTLGQPNWLAAYLCLLLPLAVDCSLRRQRRFSFIFYLLSLIFYLCLLYTKSKTGILAALICLCLYCLKNITLLFSRRLSFIFYLLPFVFLSLFIPIPLRDLLVKPQNLPLVPNPTIIITPSENIRKLVWRGALDLWRRYTLFGTGTETFAYAYYWTRPAAHNLTSEWDFIYNKTHNEYLNYLATTGAFGFISYLLLTILIFYRLLIADYHLLISFLSILITNFTGFSVVIVSLFFFLLPALSAPPQTFTRQLPKLSLSRISFVGLLLSFIFYLLSRVLFFYLADLTYAQALSLNDRQQYALALDQINLSLRYRPDEALYLIHQATLLSRLAILHQDSQLAQAAAAAASRALDLSPANINFYKEQAQVYYYLAALDPTYLKSAVNSLANASLLAPTDAKTFFLMGKFFETAKDYALAIQAYQQAIDLKPNYDHAYFAQGQLYLLQKNFAPAKFDFEQTLKYAPANADAQKFLDQIKIATTPPASPRLP